MLFIRLLAFLCTAIFAAAQLNTLPECVQTCLHNTLPQCSGLKCYCSAFNSTSLVAASSCYHSLCDSTNPRPFDVFMADIGPLCFQQSAPILESEIDEAASIESLSSVSTYLSLSDPPNTATNSPATASGTGTGTSAGQATAVATTAVKSGQPTFAVGSRGSFGQVVQQSSSNGAAGYGVVVVRGTTADGWAASLVMTAAGLLLEVLG